jgi:hypothetical protein
MTMFKRRNASDERYKQVLDGAPTEREIARSQAMIEKIIGPAGIGDNKAPGPIDHAKEALAELNNYLKEAPVIQTPKEAKEAGGWLERSRIAIKELEDERTDKVGPLNTKLKSINDLYRAVRDPLEKVTTELRRRLTAYTNAEEAKRRAEADRLRQEAEAAAEEARKAAAAADDAVASVDVGEIGVDAGGAIADADAAIRQAGIAERAALRAQRESTVRIASVMGNRALAPRTVEVLTVTDAVAAIKEMGMTAKITDAILSSARDYRKEFGELPAGIGSESKRSV